MKMEFEGTPWTVETVKTDGEISEIYILSNTGGCVICINNGDDNYDIEGDLVNAHLVAAAPDLLEALQLLINSIKRDGVIEQYDKEYEIAESAISKSLNHDH